MQSVNFRLQLGMNVYATGTWIAWTELGEDGDYCTSLTIEGTGAMYEDTSDFGTFTFTRLYEGGQEVTLYWDNIWMYCIASTVNINGDIDNITKDLFSLYGITGDYKDVMNNTYPHGHVNTVNNIYVNGKVKRIGAGAFSVRGGNHSVPVFFKDNEAFLKDYAGGDISYSDKYIEWRYYISGNEIHYYWYDKANKSGYDNIQRYVKIIPLKNCNMYINTVNDALKTVHFSNWDEVESIESSAFADRVFLEGVIVGDDKHHNPDTIDDYIFSYCTSIVSVPFDKNLDISVGMFNNCYSLTSFNSDNSIASVKRIILYDDGKCPFYNCVNIKDVKMDKNFSPGTDPDDLLSFYVSRLFYVDRGLAPDSDEHGILPLTIHGKSSYPLCRRWMHIDNRKCIYEVYGYRYLGRPCIIIKNKNNKYNVLNLLAVPVQEYNTVCLPVFIMYRKFYLKLESRSSVSSNTGVFVVESKDSVLDLQSDFNSDGNTLGSITVENYKKQFENEEDTVNTN